MAKCQSQKVSEVSNTSPNARIWLFLETATLCFTSCCSLVLIYCISPRTSQVSDYLLSLSLWFCFRVSLLSLSSSLLSEFLDNETASAATALGTTNLHISVHTFGKQELLIAFLNGTDVCTQATPLLAFLKHHKLHS